MLDFESPYKACSAFTRVTACTLALSPIRDTHSEGLSCFVTSIAAPVASGWSDCRVDLHPLESAAFPRRTGKADDADGHGLCDVIVILAQCLSIKKDRFRFPIMNTL